MDPPDQTGGRVLGRRYSDSANGNGRIVHEVTTAGATSNPGSSQETTGRSPLAIPASE